MTKIERVESNIGGTPVNAYLVEGERQLVAVDGTLTVSGGRALRARAVETGKPLDALVLTHSHPDHYGGAIEAIAGSDAPIVSTTGVATAIRRDDAVKEAILRPMFGDEWPRERAFPTQIVEDGAQISFGDIDLTVRDLGPGESPHDSIWFLGEDQAALFSGDQAYNHMHCYLADGHWEAWLANIDRLSSELPSGAVLHPGHGDSASRELLEWQRGYILRFVEAVTAADWSVPDRARSGVIDEMGRYLDRDDLHFLMELSVEPVASQLGLLGPEASR